MNCAVVRKRITKNILRKWLYISNQLRKNEDKKAYILKTMETHFKNLSNDLFLNETSGISSEIQNLSKKFNFTFTSNGSNSNKSNSDFSNEIKKKLCKKVIVKYKFDSYNEEKEEDLDKEDKVNEMGKENDVNGVKDLDEDEEVNEEEEK